jgi:L-aminopeptidase/D-esterase-like protein
VTGAIIFDVGPRRYSTVLPDEALGRVAFNAAAPGRFPLGAHGAGRFAMQSGYFGDDYRSYSGQGGAFRQVGPTKIAVFTVVNALGAVVDRNGNIVRCAKPPCGTIAARLATVAAGFSPPSVPSSSTTLTLVVTNQKLPFWGLQRLAMQVHTSMARAIQPFQTTNDGDVLFAVSTDEVENEKLNVASLGLIASELAWDAVLSSVPELRDPSPSAGLGMTPEGEYEFAFGRGAKATIARSGGALTITANRNSLYLPANTPVALVPLSGNDYRIANARRSLLRVDESGFTINPGHWPIRATRVTP